MLLLTKGTFYSVMYLKKKKIPIFTQLQNLKNVSRWKDIAQYENLYSFAREEGKQSVCFRLAGNVLLLLYGSQVEAQHRNTIVNYVLFWLLPFALL